MLAIIGGVRSDGSPSPASTLPVPGASPEAPSAGLRPVGPIADVAIRAESRSEQRAAEPAGCRRHRHRAAVPPSPPSCSRTAAAVSSELQRDAERVIRQLHLVEQRRKALGQLPTARSSSTTPTTTSSGCRQVGPCRSATATGSVATRSSSRPTASGNITRRFKVGSSERAFEPEGRQWLAKMLPRFIRQSGFGAKERVAQVPGQRRGARRCSPRSRRSRAATRRRCTFTQLMTQAPLDAADRPPHARAGRPRDRLRLRTGVDADRAAPTSSWSTRRPGRPTSTRRARSSPTTRCAGSSAALERAAPSRRRLARRGLLDALAIARFRLRGGVAAAGVRERHPDRRDAATRSSRPSRRSTPPTRRAGCCRRCCGAAMFPDDTLLAALRSTPASIGSDYETAQVLHAAARAHAINGPLADVYVRTAEARQLRA